MVARKQTDYNVHVVRHDAPGKQAVTVFIEVAQRAGQQTSDRRVLEVACAGTGVEIALDAHIGEMRDPLSLIRREVAVELCRGNDDVVLFGFDLIKHGARKGIA